MHYEKDTHGPVCLFMPIGSKKSLFEGLRVASFLDAVKNISRQNISSRIFPAIVKIIEDNWPMSRRLESGSLNPCVEVVAHFNLVALVGLSSQKGCDVFRFYGVDGMRVRCP